MSKQVSDLRTSLDKMERPSASANRGVGSRGAPGAGAPPPPHFLG